MTGTLVVQDAGLSRAANDYAFAASMNGNLTQKDGAVREVNSALYGNFFGTNGEIINGDVVGSYTLNGDTRRFDGDFTGVEE